MARGKLNPWMLGALGVAGAALVADQFLTSASASDAAEVAPGDVLISLDEEVPAAPAPGGVTLADRFQAFQNTADQDGAGLSNAFGAIAAEKHETVVEPGTKQAGDHGVRLTAILRRPEGHIAVINGRPLRVGQSIEGVRVTAIRDREVELETSVGPITLRLNVPSLEGS